MTKEKAIHRVWIIDDDAFLLEMYALKFTQKGFEVTTSSSASEALEKMRAGEPVEIILVDLVMPSMDGFTFLEQLQKDHFAEKALTIALSNLGQEEDIARVQALGAVGFIVKASATPSEVVDRVLTVVEKNTSA
jgi:two-component system chemotaxis response regulator CheY